MLTELSDTYLSLWQQHTFLEVSMYCPYINKQTNIAGVNKAVVADRISWLGIIRESCILNINAT